MNPITEKNLEVLDKFFHREKLNGENISILFAEGCVKKLFRGNGDLMYWRGKEEIAENYITNKTYFPTWSHGEVKYYFTEDPNFIWALTYGHGEINAPDMKGPYSNYYMDAFYFENGLIKQFTEYNNPEHILQDFVEDRLAAHKAM